MFSKKEKKCRVKATKKNGINRRKAQTFITFLNHEAQTPVIS